MCNYSTDENFGYNKVVYADNYTIYRYIETLSIFDVESKNWNKNANEF